MTIDPATIRTRIEGSVRAVTSLINLIPHIEAAANALAAALDRGNQVLTCGNGGSAAEALHLAEELIGKYRAVRRPLPAFCLNADPTALTCIANDYGFDEVFARQVEGYAKRGDVLVAFSTSGKSPNVLRALTRAQERGVTTIGLLGKGGGACVEHCDHAIIVPNQDTAHIQEAHQVIVHLFLEAVEG